MEFPDNYIEFNISDIHIFTWAISQFKDAVMTILLREDDWKTAILPDIDIAHYEWFVKQTFIITPSLSLIPWNIPR